MGQTILRFSFLRLTFNFGDFAFVIPLPDLFYSENISMVGKKQPAMRNQTFNNVSRNGCSRHTSVVRKDDRN